MSSSALQPALSVPSTSPRGDRSHFAPTLRAVCILAALLLAACPFAWGQSEEAVLRNAVYKHHLYLRDFNAQDEIRGEWINGAVQIPPATVHELCTFFANYIKITNDSIEMEGERSLVMRTDDTKIAPSNLEEKVHIIIRTHGAPLSSVLPATQEALFFPSAQAALAAVPMELRDSIPGEIDSACCRKSPKVHNRACDCAHLADPVCEGEHGLGTQGMKPPRITYQVAPEMSEEARRKRRNSEVLVTLRVDPTGVPSDLWVASSPGLGLGKQAAKAVSQYRFEPATCHGTPVPVNIVMSVSFDFM